MPVAIPGVAVAGVARAGPGVGVEPLICLDFWDRGRACARAGGWQGPGVRRGLAGEGVHTMWSQDGEQNDSMNGIHFRAPLINVIFFLKKKFLMWGGGGVRRRSPGCHPPLPNTPIIGHR